MLQVGGAIGILTYIFFFLQIFVNDFGPQLWATKAGLAHSVWLCAQLQHPRQLSLVRQEMPEHFFATKSWRVVP